MIVLIGSEKGGTGKSTVATNLAVWLATKGKDVLLFDADKQRTSAKWAVVRGQDESLAKVNCVEKTGNVLDALKDLSARYDEIVIDAGGRDSEELRYSMGIADRIYTPTKASQADVWTMESMDNLVKLARAFNSSLEAHMVISMASTNYVVREAQEAYDFLAENSTQYTVSDSVIKDRKVFRDAMGQGMGVIEMNNGKALDEMDLLAEEIYGIQEQS
jgi:chromosome partitioning protein